MKDIHRQVDDIAQLTAFLVGDEEYVVDILRIREIIKPLPITSVRCGPKYVQGVVSLRGIVVPVVDMRVRFGIEPRPGKHVRMVIMAVDGRLLGLIVDQVTEVVRLPVNSIRPAPGILEGGHAPYFMGVVQHRNRLLTMLNVRAVVSSEEMIDPLSEELRFLADQNMGVNGNADDGASGSQAANVAATDASNNGAESVAEQAT